MMLIRSFSTFATIKLFKTVKAQCDQVFVPCEDLPLPIAHMGDKKVKRFHFSEITGRLPYVRATVTFRMAAKDI
jgi:hypothetical protein